jgi:transposase
MEKESKNIEIIIGVMSVFMGTRIIKQVLCVILLIFGVEEKKIMSGLKVSPNTVKKYADLINSGRLSELFEDNLYRPKSKLEDFRAEIMSELDKHPAHTLREAAVVIEKLTGLKRSIPQVRNFLKKTDTGH